MHSTFLVGEKDVLHLDLRKKVLVNKTKKKTIHITIPGSMIVLHKANGVIPYLQQHGLAAIETVFLGGSI